MTETLAPIKVEQRNVAELIPFARNSRTHSDAQVAQIAASIREFGWTNPILIDGENTIIAGHGRLLAARKLGMEDVPAIILDHLSKAQQRALVIADNQLALNAGWDMDMLKAEIEDLKLEDFDLGLLGFDDKFLDGLLEPEPTEGLTDEDAVPDVPEQPKTVLGDVWVLGNHRLMCGDSTSIDAVDKLMSGTVPNAVITDPPYGIGIDGQKKSISANPKHNRKHHEKKGWDAERPDASIFGYIVALGVPTVIWGGNYFADLLPATRGWLYWSIEFSADYLSVPQKGAVLDLFSGSGTLSIVCEKTDRRAFMMERDAGYCDVIINRWQDFTGQQAVHAETGETFNASR